MRLPEASWLLQRGGPLLASLWEFGESITLGNHELLLIISCCVTALLPRGASLLLPEAPRSPSHSLLEAHPALALRIRPSSS